jgi:hypothetical protein
LHFPRIFIDRKTESDIIFSEISAENPLFPAVQPQEVHKMDVHNFASKGVGAAGLTTGIIGTSLSALNAMGNGGLLSGLLGGGNCGCNEDHWVNRYEAAQSARIADLETEVKLRDANTYTLTEMGKLRDYVDRRFDGVNAQLCNQNVLNAQVSANLSCMQGNIATLMGLTKTVVPITSVCPEPMALYNSWTAPTATAATTG